MKTKHLLFCAAIGAAFTACTADEDLVLNNNAVDSNLAIRPVVGTEISLGGGVDSRLAVGTGVRPVFDDVDALGAAVIDVPLYTDAADYAEMVQDGDPLYDIVDYYGCNNAFTTANAGNTWTAEQAMVEGNYLFYAPYNEDLALRTPMTVAVPRIQDASTDKKALEDFYADVNNVAMVGYKYITGTEKKRPSVELFNIFAYPEFTITNNFDGYLFNGLTANAEPTKAWNGAVKLDSIQFVNVDDSRDAIAATQIGGLLSHDNIATELASTGDWADAKKLLSAKTTDLLNTSAGQIVNNRHNQPGVITTAIVGRTIEQGASIKVACVMPAMSFNFDDSQLLAKLYFTIDGKNYVMYDGAVFSALTELQTKTKLDATLTAEQLGYAMDAKGEAGLSTLTLVAGQRVAGEAINVKNGEYSLKPESGRSLLNIELTGGKAKAGETNTVQIMNQTSADAVVLTGVTTTAELITLIENAANGTAWTESAVAVDGYKPYKIETTNTVEINAALIDALSDANNNPGGSFAIKSVVPVANDVTVTGVSGTKVTFTSVSGKSYDVTLTNAVTDPTASAKQYVILTDEPTTVGNLANDVVIWAGTSNATVTLDAHLTLTSLHTAKIMNSATPPANTVKDLTLAFGDYKFTAANINNASTLSISGANAANAITAFDNEGTLTITGAKFDTSKTVLNNNGTVTVTTNSTFNVNSGIGTLNINEDAVNSIIGVVNPGAQYVEFITTANLATAQIVSAEALGYVDAINVTDDATLLAADVEKFGDIKNIIVNGAVNFSEAETYDLTGFTIKLATASAWTGTTGTTVNGVNINLNQKTLELTNIFVNGTRTGKGTINANGYTAKWNLGGSVTYNN